MSYKKIPKSVKEIVEVFIQYKFRPMTYKQISQVLNKDVNAIIQRIKRNEEGYFEITNKRPYQISLKKNVKEVYFQRDRNQCQICHKTFNPEKLVLRFKNPHLKNKYTWNNGFTSCTGCKNKQIAKKSKAKTQKKQQQKQDIWEYKEIHIKKLNLNNVIAQYIEDYLPQINFSDFGPFNANPPLSQENEMEEEHYEFDELNGEGWFYLLDDDNQISSFSITEILDHFGNEGWELVSLIEVNPGATTMAQFQAYSQMEIYRCIFKRKKK
ncbi:MAG: HNH endonuclease [Promethearchaeota archaeon]